MQAETANGTKLGDATTISDEVRITESVNVNICRLVIEPVSGTQDGWQSHVYLDGVKQDGICSLTLRMEVGKIPLLTTERHLYPRSFPVVRKDLGVE